MEPKLELRQRLRRSGIGTEHALRAGMIVTARPPTDNQEAQMGIILAVSSTQVAMHVADEKGDGRWKKVWLPTLHWSFEDTGMTTMEELVHHVACGLEEHALLQIPRLIRLHVKDQALLIEIARSNERYGANFEAAVLQMSEDTLQRFFKDCFENVTRADDENAERILGMLRVAQISDVEQKILLCAESCIKRGLTDEDCLTRITDPRIAISVLEELSKIGQRWRTNTLHLLDLVNDTARLRGLLENIKEDPDGRDEAIKSRIESLAPRATAPQSC